MPYGRDSDDRAADTADSAEATVGADSSCPINAALSTANDSARKESVGEGVTMNGVATRRVSAALAFWRSFSAVRIASCA